MTKSELLNALSDVPDTADIWVGPDNDLFPITAVEYVNDPPGAPFAVLVFEQDDKEWHW